MTAASVSIFFWGSLLLLAAPFCWEQLSTASVYWFGSGDVSAPYYEDNPLRNRLFAIALTASCVMGPTAQLAIMSRGSMVSRVLYGVAILSLLSVVGALLVLYNAYGGTGRHLGQTALAIHSGTTFCVVSLFVIYRYWEARRSASDYQPLFEKQLVLLCLGPFFYQVAHGAWFLILGHRYDGIWAQQTLLSFGCFLIPLFIVYVGSYVYREREMESRAAIVVAGISLAFVVAGLVGFRMSEVKPSLI